jgi:Cof subfamily protein (haloacid dehalogenase superfamily)
VSAAARPYDLVATDLDGTLLRTDVTVSPRTRAALAAATAAGAAHLVVTGRGVAWTRPILDAIGYTGLAVCGQGAQLYDAGQHRMVTSVTLDRQLARLVIAKIEAETGPLSVAADWDGLEGRVLSASGYVFHSGLVAEPVTDQEELWAAPLNKVYIQHAELGHDALGELAHELAGDLVSVIVSGEGLVELLPLGLSKATGLRLAARHLGVTADRTIAFGDMPNDIPMFSWAAYGVAMANAHPALKAVADEVTFSNDEDGVAAVLERFFPAFPT